MSDLARRLAERVPPAARERIAALPRGRSLAVAGLLVLLLVAILTDGSERPQPGAAGPAPPAPVAAPTAKGGAQGDDPVADLIAEMPLEQKVAQLFLVGFDGTDADAEVFSELREDGFGGLVLTSDNYVDAKQLERLTGDAVAAAKRGDSVPPWIMAAQEGGEFSAFVDQPPTKAPADVRTPEEAADLALEAGRALERLGVNGILAPVVDVAPLSGGAVGRRAFSDSTAKVVPYAEATVEAYDRAGVFAAAKHFPGLGGASQPTEVGPANVGLSVEELEQRDLRPFEAAIDAGVPGIVVGHGLYVTDDFLIPASLSPTVIGDLLREQVGFDGVAITDDLTAGGVTFSVPTSQAAVDALAAGDDMLMIGDEAARADAYDAVLSAVEDGDVPMERVDEALTRVLEAKDEYGLLD